MRKKSIFSFFCRKVIWFLVFIYQKLLILFHPIDTQYIHKMKYLQILDSPDYNYNFHYRFLIFFSINQLMQI
jgi:hypothetical protein